MFHAWACVAVPYAPPPNETTWPIANGESWHAVQVAAFAVIVSHCFGSVTPVGFMTTVAIGPRSRLYELFTWQALQLMPTPGHATSAA